MISEKVEDTRSDLASEHSRLRFYKYCGLRTDLLCNILSDGDNPNLDNLTRRDKFVVDKRGLSD